MVKRFRKHVSALALLLLACAATAQAAMPTAKAAPNVVLVTLDGVRTQEVFGGMDQQLMRDAVAGKKADAANDFASYQASTPQARRDKLMPFFWNVLMRQHGWVAGNAALGSQAMVGNTMRFSYPGYAEMLTGRPRDEAITSNDALRNPYPTVSEFVRAQLQLPRTEVATFGSWDRFEQISEHVPGSITLNAGFMPFADGDPGIARLSAIQADARAWREERFDAFTIAFALRYLERERPRLLHVALGDPDEWAHANQYADYLDSLALADRFLQQLWTWLQSQPDYRDNTLLIVTTDHGRGRTLRDWSDHGADVEGAQDIWIAMAGMGQTARGELRDAPPLRQAQIAATIAQAFGLDLRAQEPQAEPAIRVAPSRQDSRTR